MKILQLFSYIVSLIILSTPFIVNGQNVMDMPVSFYKMNDDIWIDFDNNTEKSGLYWVVFSARDNNLTYSYPTKSKTKKNLKFLDKLYITDVVNNYAHIYKDNTINVDWSLSSQAEDCGWIEFNNLILSNHCLVTEKSLIAKKCLVINTLKSLKGLSNNDLKKSVFNVVSLFSDPDLHNEIEVSLNIMQIFYIYKIKFNKGKPYSLLVGISPSIDNPENKKDVQSTIIGWVSFSRVVEWNNRIAVEPNYESKAVTERKKKNIMASVFNTKRMADYFSKGKHVNTSSIIWLNDSYGKRKTGSWIRFPILGFTDEIYTLGIIGNFNSSQQTAVFTPSVYDQLTKYGLTQNQINTIKSNNIPVLLEGFAPLNVKGLTCPLYKEVVLFSAEEFNRTYAILYKLLAARDTPERREKLYDTWVDILSSYFGGIDKSELEKMSVGEIQELVFGLPGVDGLIKDISLKDINNKSKLSDKELNGYLRNIKHKYRMIEDIINDSNNPMVFYSNNKKYYWIDGDFIP